MLGMSAELTLPPHAEFVARVLWLELTIPLLSVAVRNTIATFLYSVHR